MPTDAECADGTRDWPHAPPHRLAEAGVYMVTARTIDAVPHFESPERRTFVRDLLLELAEKYSWQLGAWTVLTNHSHFIGHSPADDSSARTLRKLLQHLHANISRHVNTNDGGQGRQFWQNYWDKRLTYRPSYLARLHYVHANAVHHGIVKIASEHEWCSARAFKEACTPAWVKTIGSFKYDSIAEADGE